jgi:hypothetical protein
LGLKKHSVRESLKKEEGKEIKAKKTEEAK